MINFAIVGCGNIAQRHAKHIKKAGKLLAVCDTKKDKAHRLARKYGAIPYYNIDKLLEKENSIDIVNVCTPNGLHAKHTIKCLNKGKHVLCEKPMAIKSKDCKKMIDSAKKAKKKLFIVKQNRFNPPVMAVKKALDSNKLGKILSVSLNCFWNRNAQYYKESDWKGTNKLDGGILFTQFSHFIDLIYWLLGDVKKVSAYKKNFNHKKLIEFEDTCVASVKFRNGSLGTLNFTINAHSKNMEGSITLFGSKGTVKIGGQYLNELEYQNITGYKIGKLPQGNPPNKYGHYEGSMSNHDKVIKNVIDVLEKNGRIATSGEEGMKTVQIIEKIYNSTNQ